MTIETITNSTHYLQTLELYPNDTNLTKVETITPQQYELFVSNNNGQVQTTYVSNDITTHASVFINYEETK